MQNKLISVVLLAFLLATGFAIGTVTAAGIPPLLQRSMAKSGEIKTLEDEQMDQVRAKDIFYVSQHIIGSTQVLQYLEQESEKNMFWSAYSNVGTRLIYSIGKIEKTELAPGDHQYRDFKNRDFILCDVSEKNGKVIRINGKIIIMLNNHWFTDINGKIYETNWWQKVGFHVDNFLGVIPNTHFWLSK